MNMARLRATPLLALCVACSGTKSAGPPALNVVTITATDFVFDAPDTIPAGLTTFRMLNQGRELHQAVIFGAPGKTFAELEAAEQPTESMVGWWHAFLAMQPTLPGGPGVVTGGDSSIITANLAPGNYVIACFMASPDGKLHVQKGMFRRLVVTPAPAGATAAAEPKSDVTVTLSDFAFATSSPLTAGTHTIRVENSGPQIHELTIERLAPGKTLADFQQWLAGGMRGPPVSAPVGGFAGPDKGKVGWVTVTLTPGTYLLTCYVPDAKDGAPHLLHGMVQQVTIS
ncbi:MAG: hypothetical protein DMD54_00125 [Gemmatimonadetes bacterium]|nr:MAG: hypothetical protein DMD54_00125 [Gemmatimonadota bacterium]